MLCKCLKNCSACPHSFRECCNNGEKNGFEEWLNEEAKMPKDAPKNVPRGWIKLKTIANDIIYIDVSKIVGLGNVTPGTGLATGAVTEVYTIGAEDEPWFVYDSIEEIVEKIKKECKCLKCFSLA
jgi:hypothetical protein